MKIRLTQVFFCLRKDPIKLIMRTFIFLFCTTLFGFSPRHAVSQNDRIVIDTDQVVSVDKVFKIVKAQTNYSFVYYENLFKDYPKVALKKGAIRLNKLLTHSLSSGRVHVIFTANNTILIKERTSKTKAQQLSVSGIVMGPSGLPVSGATVLIKGTRKGAVTDLDGRYVITVPDPASVLIFSSLGFETQEKVVGNQTTINVNLKENISALDAVTIRAGYYNTSQREVTGSISKIDSKIIEKQPVNNPLAAMQGHMPGVNISQRSGTPGGGFNIEIRGKNFIGSNTEPFYIIDGVPFSTEAIGQNLSNPAISLGNVLPLNAINPSDIESIEVLKDADATAIYGSRGANGVVLITTKRGKSGKTRVNANVSSTVGKVSSFVDLMNTEQYLEMRLEALSNEGYTLETAPDDFKARAHDLYRWDPDRYTDWQEELLGGTSYRHNVQLSFSGGSEQTQFLISGGYQNETTVFPGDSNYGKVSLNSRINHQSADGRFQISLSTNYTADDNQLPGQDLTDLAYSLVPNAPALYDENGDLNWENFTWANPLARLEDQFRAQNRTLIMNSVISYRPVPDLVIKTNLGYTSYSTEQYLTQPHTRFAPAPNNTSERSILVSNNATRQSWIVEPQVHWQKAWGKASFNILLGATFQQQQSQDLALGASNFPSNSQILDLSAANLVNVRLDAESEYNYQAFFGRLNFKWADKYIINLTGRRDGSSRFGPGRQFGNFGAVGMAWLFTEEGFLEGQSVLSFGKLRSSYGITGSDGIPNYGFYDTYESSGRDYDGSVLEPTGLFNPIFGWESNKKFEAALELGFFQDRIFVTAAWYRNRSSNQLVGIPLPRTTGFSSINANFDATVENTGLEVDFRSVNIQNKGFKWTTTFNISVPKNKLVKFDGLEASTFRDRYIVGEPLSIVKLYHNLGVDPETGIYQFEDYNNDGEIDRKDRQWIVQTAPKFYGGLGNTIKYKNWTLNAFLNFKKQSASDLTFNARSPGSLTNQHVSVLNRWQGVGDQAGIQRYITSLADFNARLAFSNDFDSSRRYTDASFIRLRSVSLSYDLPKDLVSGFNASIYLQGQNLFFLYSNSRNADAEQVLEGTRMPLLRQLTLGLQLGF
ncbi:SusC/RagA family TonB-linked outer membrane protein [Flavivirga amylovorans]|uniref:SusC/RagA family TonB-linked outer membrane protein n=2 Tax=Flavivirga amylovorans TaxID=870486 RepID=A0ABT8X6B3_9FLAO|nr:SusC/RagA family TonB-linked outer membrane protein [Flavivirga amylovorans]MDO5989535.1 SusC/RagA family TonB-linked outer membrane protein [Flavivirga amylovorans]